jgi:hypothetical protein
MRRRYVPWLLAAGLAAVPPAGPRAALAQDDSGTLSAAELEAFDSVPRVVFQTVPSRGYLRFEGGDDPGNIYRGEAPYELEFPLEGDFRYRIEKTGYENVWGTVTFDLDGSGTRLGSVSQDTPTRSLIQSAFWPGLGQWEREHRLKSVVFAGLTLTTLVFAIDAHSEYSDVVDELEGVVGERGRATQLAEIEALERRIGDLEDLSEERYSRRNRWLWTLGGIWGVNLLDAYLNNGGGIVTYQSPTALRWQLTLKSPARAFVRSAVLPGWGQYYLGSRGKGSLLMGTGLFALGALWWADDAYQEQLREYRQAARRVVEASTAAEQVVLAELARREEDDADRAQDRRRNVFLITAFYWAANLADLYYLTEWPQPDSGPFLETSQAGGEPGLRAGWSWRWGG